MSIHGDKEYDTDSERERLVNKEESSQEEQEKHGEKIESVAAPICPCGKCSHRQNPAFIGQCNRSRTRQRAYKEKKKKEKAERREKLKEFEDDRAPLGASTARCGAVLITNLHSCISGEDMEDLFSTIGTIVSSRKIKENAAEVVFLNEEDAYRSIEMLHKRQLDGQPMYVELMPDSIRLADGSFKPHSYGMLARDRLRGSGGLSPERDILRDSGFMTARDRLGGSDRISSTSARLKTSGDVTERDRLGGGSMAREQWVPIY